MSPRNTSPEEEQPAPAPESPQAARATELQTVSVRVVGAFRAVSRAFGFDSTEIWEREGFSAAQLEDPDTRVPLEVAQRLLGWAVAATGLSDFGLRAAELAEPGLFDLPEYAARSQATLRGALECVRRLQPLIAEGNEIVTESVGDTSTITFTTRGPIALDPPNIEFTLAYLQLAGRRFTGMPQATPTEVRFRHAAPEDTSHHEKLFGAPVKFGASADRMVLPTSQLELPLIHADSHLSAIFHKIAERLLAETPQRSTFAERVRRLITEHVSDDGAPVTLVAQALAITPRTLHRRLEEEGLTFRQLADDVRKGLALAYLDQRHLAIGEIAYLLGFSSVQAFHRAFKRWTNETPGAYRERAR